MPNPDDKTPVIIDSATYQQLLDKIKEQDKKIDEQNKLINSVVGFNKELLNNNLPDIKKTDTQKNVQKALEDFINE